MNSKIEKGDLVEYIDTGQVRIGKGIKSIKIPMYGIWDGEKAEMTDREKTTVRNTEWLTLIIKNFNWKCRFDESNKNTLILESIDGKRKHYIAIPPGRNRIDLFSFESYTNLKLSYFNGYFYNFEGLIILTDGSKRKVLYKGMTLAETDIKIHFK